MAFEDSKKASTVEKDFQAPSVCRCGRPAQVATATCVNKSTGAMKTGTASEFCGRDNNNNPNWVLQDWWEINKYEGWCSDCYSGLPKYGKRRYTDDQVRTAWRWLIGETSAEAQGSLGQTFKRIRLTDDQRDTAIEIVNYEAHRTNQPDSIPDDYKLPHMWA